MTGTISTKDEGREDGAVSRNTGDAEREVVAEDGQDMLEQWEGGRASTSGNKWVVILEEGGCTRE